MQSPKRPRPIRTLPACFAIAAILAGCRSTVRLPPTEAPPSSAAVVKLDAGSALAVRRPTPEVALVSLWLDVGSMDVTPPAVATAAALWAARGRAEARVYPTAIELRVLCDAQTEPLQACATRLAGALAAAPPGEHDVEGLRAQLRALREGYLAEDSAAAEWAAFSALAGEQAARSLPWGGEQDDARVDAQAIGAYLRTFVTPARALLVGAGDVDSESLSGALASKPAEARLGPAPLAAQSGVRVVVGARNVAAFALAVPSAPIGAAIAQGFRDAFPFATARVAEQRGLSVVYARLDLGTQVEERVSQAASELRRLALEHTSLRPAAPPETLDGIVRNIGEEWAARAQRAPLAAPWPLALGLSVQGAANAAQSDDDKLSAKLRADAERWLAAANTRSTPALSGDSGERSAELKLDNGVRIAIERRPGDQWFAAALRFNGGAARDPSSRHGRAALLATLMTSSCGAQGARGLDGELTRIGARLRPLVTGDGVGVLVSAPHANAEAALDLLLRCALRPTLGSAALEDARARLLRTLTRDSAPRFQAALARLLAPLAPGALAVWGTPVGIASLSLPELQRFHGESAVGSATSLWIAGDEPDDRLALFAARRLASLSEGRAQPASELGAQVALEGAQEGDDALTAVVGVRRASALMSTVAGDVFSAALADALSERVGRPIAAWGSAASGIAAGGVALRVTEEELPLVQVHAREALKALASIADDAWRAQLAQQWARDSAQLSSAAGAVEAAFRSARIRPRSLDEELALVRHFVREEPVFAILRARP